MDSLKRIDEALQRIYGWQHADTDRYPSFSHWTMGMKTVKYLALILMDGSLRRGTLRLERGRIPYTEEETLSIEGTDNGWDKVVYWCEIPCEVAHICQEGNDASTDS